MLIVFSASVALGQVGEGDILPFEPDDTLEEIRYKIDYNGYDFTVDHNWVFDMSPGEKAAFFSRRAPLHPRAFGISDDIGPLAAHLGRRQQPSSFDWRDYGGHSYIGDIRDQGTCGSCYAFGAVAAAEGTYNWAMGLYDGSCSDFSEAFVAFCLSDHYSGFDGCDGANYDYDELTALVEYGVCTEAEYPYTDNEQPCPFGTYPSLTQFQSWHRIPCNDIDAIKTAIMTYGVVDAAVWVGSAFQGYSGGIYEDTNTACDGNPCYDTTSNHAISLVGWDDNPSEGGEGVWILRNSWGDTWGESGYMRIRYTSAVVACAATYLVFSQPPTPTATPTWDPAIPTYTPTITPTVTPTPTLTPTPGAQSIPFTEDFEGTWVDGAPELWAKEYISGANDWTRASGGHDGYPATAHGGSYNARFFYNDWTMQVTRLISPRLDFGLYTYNTQLTFWHAMEEWQGDQDELAVYYKTSASGPWTMLWSYAASVPSWTERSITLPNPSSDYYVCFQGTANWGYGVCIDDVLITGETDVTPTPAGPTATPTITPTSTGNTPTPTPYAPWPMFRHDVENTGRSSYTGPRSAALSWSYVTGHEVKSSPSIGPDGRIYLGCRDNRVYALNPSGSLAWSYITGATTYGVYSSPAVDPDCRVYVGSRDEHTLYALDYTGDLSWSYVTGDFVHSSPVPGSGGRLYVGSYDNRLYALGSTGSLSWSYVTGNAVRSSPAVGPDGRVYVGSEDNGLYAVTFAGALAWSYLTGDWVVSSPAVGSGGGVYAGSYDGGIYALTSAGSLSWSYVSGGNVYSSPAIGFDGRIYVGSWDNNVYAINSTGSLAWTHVTGDSVYSSPAIGSGGLLYIASDDTRIYALNSTGSLTWSYGTGEGVRSSPSIGPYGRVYVGSQDNRVYCFGEEAERNLAILVREGAGDLNMYFWNAPGAGDWTRWDAVARNPSPLARDFWQIPIGNDGIGITSIDIAGLPDGGDELGLLVRQGLSDLNIYFWNAPGTGDWTMWDAVARNPSPLARDFWQIPIGNDGIGITSIDITEPADGKDEIALLVRQGANDLNMYFWNAPLPGDWTRWDAVARNPSPLAQDFWQIPIGNDGIGLTSIDIDGNGRDELGLFVRQGLSDLNIYFWNALVPGDWTYWDAVARNPSSLARDFWQIPVGNDSVGLTGIGM